MWWNRPTPTRRTASSRPWVPITLVAKKSPGRRIARLLCDSAAKLTTTSTPYARSRCSTSSVFAIEPWTNSTPSRPSTFSRTPA